MLRGIRVWLRRRSARKEAERRLQSLASQVRFPEGEEPSATGQFENLRAELDRAVEEKRKARETASKLNLSLKDKKPL